MKITIDGVNLKDLKVVPDERGWLMEILRCDDEIYQQFGQVYMTTAYSGVVKGWHYHKEGVESYLVDLYSSGKISKGKLAELLDLDIYGVNRVLEKYHAKSSINYERFTRGIEITEKLRNIEEYSLYI